MADRDRPAERILRLAAYAHNVNRAITLDDIAADVPGYETAGGAALVSGSTEWERVRKLVGRDIEDLRHHWGIHLAYDESEHHYTLRTPFFTGNERAALIAAAAAVDVEGVDVPVPGALGSAVGDDATEIILRVHDLVAVFRAAIASRAAVRFAHDGRTRRVEPYAVGTWRTHWYVAGRDLDEGALRRFRLDRIERPAGADAVIPDGRGGRVCDSRRLRPRGRVRPRPQHVGHRPVPACARARGCRPRRSVPPRARGRDRQP